jgi:hypothetical protein
MYIRKPDCPAFKWSSLGHFLGPGFKWFFQDGGQILAAILFFPTESQTGLFFFG